MCLSKMGANLPRAKDARPLCTLYQFWRIMPRFGAPVVSPVSDLSKRPQSQQHSPSRSKPGIGTLTCRCCEIYEHNWTISGMGHYAASGTDRPTQGALLRQPSAAGPSPIRCGLDTSFSPQKVAKTQHGPPCSTTSLVFFPFPSILSTCWRNSRSSALSPGGNMFA